MSLLRRIQLVFSGANLFVMGTMFITASLGHAAATCPGNLGVSTQPNSDYVVSNVGTVKHLRTGLMWKQCVEGLSGSDCATGTPIVGTWISALTSARFSTFAGFSDWRIPNKRELESLVDNTCHTPALNTTVFPEAGVSGSGTTNSPTWTSTTVHGEPTYALTVGFKDGNTGSAFKVTSYVFRLVRGGPVFDSLAGAAPPACSLDINGDGATTADKDGVLLLRYMLGFRDASLIANVPLGSGRADAQAVQNFIGNARQFDIFARSIPDVALTQDALALVRLMLGVDDANLLSGIVVPTTATLTSAFSIRTLINERCATNF